jgi:hypothetical protein
VTSTGATPAYHAVYNAISDDGRYIGFNTRSSLLPGVPDAGSLNTYLYVKDRQTSNLLIATDPYTNLPIELEDSRITCSADGRYWFGIETRAEPMAADDDFWRHRHLRSCLELDFNPLQKFAQRSPHRGRRNHSRWSVDIFRHPDGC